MKPQEALWMYLTEPGMEHLFLAQQDQWIWADGSLLTLQDHIVIRLGYMLRLDQSGRIRQLRLDMRGAHQMLLEKWITDAGEWQEHLIEPMPELAGCLVFDIPQSFVTKSLALRQITLKESESSDFLVASFDPMTRKFEAEKCRYTCLQKRDEGNLYSYENLSRKVSFKFQTDAEGLLKDSSEVLRRIFSS